MGFFDHSKKAGRIVTLVIVLIIAGTLSVMMAYADPKAVGDLIDKWLIVLSACTAFYFGMKQGDS